MLVVRLKPYNALKGHLIRDYTAPWGTKFNNGVWYDVDDQAADYLRTVRMKWDDPHSLLAFDVCTRDEAEQLVAREESRELAKVVTENEQQNSAAPTTAHVTVDKALNIPKPRHELSASAAATTARSARAEDSSVMSDAAAIETAKRRSTRKPRGG